MLRKFLDVLPHDVNHGALWKNFIEALGLLTVAMMLALYSSSVGRDGRVISAVVSAIMALAMSVWVGLRFVPRLARNVDWHWIPFTSQHRVLREGWVYLIALAVVIFAAVNTSNNLLYMVLSGRLGADAAIQAYRNADCKSDDGSRVETTSQSERQKRRNDQRMARDFEVPLHFGLFRKETMRAPDATSTYG